MSDTKKKAPKLIPFKKVVTEWRKEPGYQEAYDALEKEYAVIREHIKQSIA
jgi:hypothetical protein